MESFRGILRDLDPQLLSPMGNAQALSTQNKLLLVLMWLKQYPSYEVLGSMFNISNATVHRMVYQTLPVLWQYFRSVIQWPTIAEWNTMRGNWDNFINGLGSIDGTLHPIRRPDVEDQRIFYSGHGHKHCISTQVLIDNQRNIRYIHSGFTGHMNDAGQFLQLPRIGPNEPLPFPADCYILGDRGYANRYPIITPYRANQMQPPNVEDKVLFNREVCAHRIFVEHVMSFIKTYNAVSNLYKHPRWLMPIIVETCAFLAQRHLLLVNELH